MRIPGFNRPERRVVADPAAGQGYVERRPGESNAAFEMRLAAAVRDRGQPAFGVRGTDAAYAKGRRDQHKVDKAERPRKRRGGGMGLIGLAVVLIAAMGILWMGLAAREGSFAAGGAVVDQKLAEVTQPARIAATEVVDKTGQAVQGAGQTLENQGQRIREKAK